MTELQTFAITNAFARAEALRAGNFRFTKDGRWSIALSVNK